MKMCSPQKQVQYFRQVSSFWSRRCFCCSSGLWLTFIGLTTARHSLWACTLTSTHSSHTSRSSVGNMRCWSRRTLSRCRTSSQLWDSKAEPEGQRQMLNTHVLNTFVFICCRLVVSGHSEPNLNLIHNMKKGLVVSKEAKNLGDWPVAVYSCYQLFV